MSGLTGWRAHLAIALIFAAAMTADWLGDQLFPPPAGGSHQEKGIDDGT